jgi:multiple antibiotic resistance protein
MTMTELLSIFITLLVIIDPIGLTPLFVSLTPDRNFQERRKIAFRATLGGFLILLLFSLFGENVLLTIGVEMGAFQISGGILLLLISIEMLFQKRAERRKKSAAEEMPDPSIFPLAIPLIAGPGAIAAVILISSDTDGNFIKVVSVNLIILLVVLIVFLCFLAGNALEKFVGRTGIDVITRLLGMLLAALAIQFIIDGFSNLGIIV